MAAQGAEPLFGTDGIRGKAGVFPLDQRTMIAIGESITHVLSEELGRAPRLIVGRDTRESGPEIERALIGGATGAGSYVECAGVITTPGVAYIARSTPFDAGIVVSASHNPYQDNGIKIFAASGKKLPDETEQRIETGVYALLENLNWSGAPVDVNALTSADYRTHYIDYLVEQVADGLSLDGLKLILDCANGSAFQVAPAVFERLGATVTVMNASPDGRNINRDCGSLHPQSLQSSVLKSGGAIGVAFDGDADRALFVDERGSLVNGDAAMLILAEYLKSQGQLAGDVVVGTVMANIGLELALKERGIELVRTPVGDKFVLEQLLARKATLGGEQSGHIIFPRVSLAGDGIITAIELLRAAKEFKMPLTALAEQLKTFPQVLLNVPVKRKPPIESLPEVRLAMDAIENELCETGRILVRYSGTENLARVMIEGEDQKRIEQHARHLGELIRHAIG